MFDRQNQECVNNKVSNMYTNMDVEKLKHIVEDYKKNFDLIKKQENYKWEAVKCFQDNWDIDAPDFEAMLRKSFSKADNLLTAGRYYALQMLIEFAKADPNSLRSLFIYLFDEERSLEDRYNHFVDTFKEFTRNNFGQDKNSFQDPHAVSVYLSFMYPEKYFIFKQSMYDQFANLVDFKTPKKTSLVNKLKNYFTFCEKVLSVILGDEQLKNMNLNRIGKNGYLDSSYHLLTTDIIYFAGEYRKNNIKMKNIKEEFGVYLRGVVLLENNSYKQYLNNIPIRLDELEDEYCRAFQIESPFIIDETDKNKSVKKIKNTLKSKKDNSFDEYNKKYNNGIPNAILNTHLVKFIREYGNSQKVETYDMSLHGAELENSYRHNKIISLLFSKKQIILQGPPGTGKTYTAKDIAEDIIYGSVSSDKKVQTKRLADSEQFQLIQFHPAYTYEDFVRGMVAESKGDHIEYKTKNKILGKFAKIAYDNFVNSQKNEKELAEEQWLDAQFEDFIRHIQDEWLEVDTGKYPLTDNIYVCAIDSDALRYKGDSNGWPQLGNRMLFKDIKQAYLDNNQNRQDITNNNHLSGLANWHASYYIRVLDKFRDFLKSNQHKKSNVTKITEQKYVMIIDEINRANLPAVLGELIYALEYRGEKVESMYELDDDNSLVLPENLYIIGTMNTADRSAGHIDYAIRRRFAFVDVLPKLLSDVDGFDEELFKEVASLFFENVEEYCTDNNVELKPSKYLSPEFRPEDVCLGHSYFIMNGNREMRLKYEIKSILKEYVKDGILKESALNNIMAL